MLHYFNWTVACWCSLLSYIAICKQGANILSALCMLSTRKQHSLAYFRHDVHSFWNGFPLCFKSALSSSAFSHRKRARNARKSLPAGGAALDPTTPAGLQPLVSPRKPSQGINTDSSSSATGFIHRVCGFWELIATTVKYCSHWVLILFVQAVTEGKESLLHPCCAYFTFFLHSIFSLHIHSFNQVIKIGLQAKEFHSKYKSCRKTTVLGAHFPPCMVLSN